MEVQVIGCMEGSFENANRVYEKDVLCPALTTCCGGGHTPKVIDGKTTRGSDVVSTIRASYYKNGERNLLENIENGRGGTRA